MRSNPEANTREICRSFRKKPTKAEGLLWECLRDRRLSGFKFRRQYPTEGYILDFYCPELKLGVEIDGQIHKDKEQLEYDQERTSILNEKGISVLRFWNSEVMNDMAKVINMINESITSIKP